MTLPVSEMISRAEAAVRAGQVGAAEIIYQQLLKLHPGNAEVLCRLGLFRERQGKLQEGLVLLQKAVQLQPDYYDAWYHLGSLLRRTRQFQAAVEAFEKAVGLNDRSPRAWLGLAQCCLDAGERLKALEMLANAVSCDKANAAAARSAALLADELGRSHLAVKFFRLCAGQFADDLEFQLRFGIQLYKSEFAVEALQVLERSFPPGRRWEADALRANCLFLLQRFDELAGLLPELANFWPDREGAFRAIEAKVLAAEGETEKARALVAAAVQRLPGSAELWYQLASLSPKDVDERQLGVLEERFQASKGTSRTMLAFALAGIYEASGNLAGQVKTLEEANGLAAREAHYDPDSERAVCLERRRLFSSRMLAGLRPVSSAPDLQPVFIAGLPRSGTTLLEQVLGAHSRITPLGESQILKHALVGLVDRQGLPGVSHLLKLPLDRWLDDLRSALVDQLAARGVKEGVFTDKSMDCWYSVGLLKAALPEARFIRVDRHPMDLGLGCYKQYFATPIPFTNSFQGIAETCRNFQETMAYWQAEGFPVHHMSYESLVANFEAEVRFLLSFLGLPFEEQCLQFHRSAGRVMTASVNQVRKGLYSSALDRWRRYGALLDPLKQAFAERGIDVEAYAPVRAE